MTAQRRFLLGGGGALMPVLVSLLAIDLGAFLDSRSDLTTGNIIGFGIRYLILFVVGGVVAYLHEDEHKSFKLFELGIVAPALITSLITAQGVAADENPLEISHARISISLISSANAQTNSNIPEDNNVAWSFSDILDGLSGRAYQKISKVKQKTSEKNIDDNDQDENSAAKAGMNSESVQDYAKEEP
ncbi:MAG: hypothetical protein DSZ28_03295 [Thiothrix sp.]|nr:MAG: hypothetical protein DSZ28_03295 [Thiothrix sp.]